MLATEPPPGALQQHLATHSKWVWTDTNPPPDNKSWTEIDFLPDGTTRSYVGDRLESTRHWYIVGTRAVEMNSGERSSHWRLTFEENFSAYTGKEENGNGRSSGYAITAGPGLAPDSAATGGVPWIAVFAGEMAKAIGWATLPLSNTVPADIRDAVAALRGGLGDEATKTPQASADAYACADRICRDLIFALDDRDNTLQQNKQTAGGKLTESWMNGWATKSARYRTTFRANSEQFAAAVRRSEKPKQPVPAGMVASVTLPPVPTAAGAPTSDFKVNSNNPLNRGAYDQHPVWSPWWGRYRY